MVSAMNVVAESMARRCDAVRGHLTERQRRVWLGVAARELGPGGVRIVARAVQVSPDTVHRGRAGLEGPQPLEVFRSRAPYGGLNWTEMLDPDLVEALHKLVGPGSRGDPMTPLRWTCKSLRTLAKDPGGQDHRASPTLVARLLHEGGYGLQANTSALEGSQSADRDAQFRHLHDSVAGSCRSATRWSASTASRRNWSGWPPRLAWPSASATCRQEPAS